MSIDHLKLAEKLNHIFSLRDETKAVALGGSVPNGSAEQDSDIDLYIFCDPVIPLTFREAIVKNMNVQDAELNLQFWDTGDAWHDPETGIEVDIMYWNPEWIESQIDQVLLHHQASLGYTTCFWATIHNSQTLHDPTGWLAHLQQKSACAYPEALRSNIIRKNHAVLRKVIPAYSHQIQKALDRNDLVSLNHRIAGLLASYFDIIFAYNRQLHPGEKRLIKKVLALCSHIPENMIEDIQHVLKGAAAPGPTLMTSIHVLINHLEEMLENEFLSTHERTLLTNR